MKNKFVAAILAFLLGSFGVHKFYLRDPGAGVFYIMLMVMTSRFINVSMILGIIDGLRYLMMSSEEFDKKFNATYYQGQRFPVNKTKKTKSREYYEVNSTSPKSSKKSVVRNNPFKKSGIQKYKEYEIEEAIDDFLKGLKLEPEDIALHFSLACAYSLMENREESFRYLQLSVEKGFKDYEKILSHDDLAFLRIQPEFEEFKKNGYKMQKSFSRDTATEDEQRVPLNDVLLAQLNRLMELRKKGVLTENEFVTERKKILAKE